MLRLSDSPQIKKRDHKVYQKMSHARDRQRATPRVGGTEPKTACQSHDRHDEGGERRRPNVRDPWWFRLIAWNAAAPPRVADFARSSLHPRRSPPHTFLSGRKPPLSAGEASEPLQKFASTPRLFSGEVVTDSVEEMWFRYLRSRANFRFVFWIVQHLAAINRMTG